MKRLTGVFLVFCLSLLLFPAIPALAHNQLSVTSVSVRGRDCFIVEGTAIAGQLVSLLLYRDAVTPETTVYADTLRAEENGSFRAEFRMSPDAQRGEYTLLLQQPESAVVEHTIFYAGPWEELPWWQQFPRLSRSGYSETGGNTLISGNAGWDAGQGMFYLEDVLTAESRIAWRDQVDREGIRRVAWIEGMGDTRVIGGALHRLDDGSYEQNPITGAARVIATPWNWDSRGPAVNAAANETVWFSAASMVNAETWQGEYVWPADLPLPTYPDGRSAVGYIGEDKTDPRNAKLYDAAAQKDINGNLVISEPNFLASGADTSGAIQIGDNYTRNFYFSKDAACPWWQEYARIGVRCLLEDGVSGFWVDNYNGWNYIGAWPVETGFGEWTVAGFRTYLAAHPEIGIADVSEFDIRIYLKEKLAEWYPDADTSDLNHSGWQDARWHDEPVWQAFCAYKADIAAKAMEDIYTIIKEEADACGVSPDSIAVMGNDIGKFALGGERKLVLDMVSTEYHPESNYPFYGSETADGLADTGHSSVSYKLYAALSEAKRATVWQYMSSHQDDTELAKVYGYEALANNTTLYTGLAGDATPGGAESTLAVNTAVAAVADAFAGRKPAGNVAILYSPQSDGYYLKPRLTQDQPDNPHRMAFYGFAYALEDANIPYVVIPEYELSAQSLAGVRTLILPNVISIQDTLVEEVIQPFVEAGGKLIITGAESGSRDTSANGWNKRSSAILADLRLDPACSANVYYDAGCPAGAYYQSSDRESWEGEPKDLSIHPDYKVSSPVFHISEGTMSAEITVTCTNADGGHVDVFLAGYDGGELSNVRVAAADLTQGSSQTVRVTGLPCEEEVKLFVWNASMHPLTAPINSINHEGTLSELLERANMDNDYVFDDLGGKTQVTVNRSADSLFLDIVNKDIDIEHDTVAPNAGGIVRIYKQTGEQFVCCRIFDEKRNVFVELPIVQQTDSMVEIRIPAFQYYTSVVLYQA